ncbi:MAG: hypothetical protein VB048_01275 [Bacteroidaceae bacterium]|nr:hypothetical protein [Bacteroidaceae bacterium]MEA5099302.1 hypothetical protein [Bacteroidales bacterium]
MKIKFIKIKEKQIMEFNLIRFWSLCKRDFKLNLRTDIFMLSVMGIISGFFVVSNPSNSGVFAFLFLILLGFAIFKEYHKKTSRTNILMLPVSNLERYFSVFVRAFIYYPIVLSLFMLMGSFVFGILYLGIGVGFDFTLLPKFYVEIVKEGVESFLETHFVFSLFFFGSIFYKKNSGLKVSLLLMGIIFSVFILFFIIAHYFFGAHEIHNLKPMVGLSDPIGIIIGIVITIFLLWISYLRVTEEQV